MKTVKEWLERLPKKVRKQFIANVRLPSLLEKKAPSLEMAFCIGFPLTESKEGFEYWSKLQHKYFDSRFSGLRMKYIQFSNWLEVMGIGAGYAISH